MVEEVVASTPAPAAAHAGRGLTGRSIPQRLSDISGDAEDRLVLSMGEFARVLGGGVVPGSVVLIGGDPGIGKSTLLLQVALEIAAQRRVLYVSGEESERQIKMRATRLLRLAEEETRPVFPDELLLVTETNLTVILEHIAEVKPALVIVDSVQTTYIPEMDLSAGSVSQVREDCLPPARAGKIFRDQRLPDRARDQGRRNCRPARPGAHCRHGFIPRRRPLPVLSPAALGEEPLWGDF